MIAFEEIESHNDKYWGKVKWILWLKKQWFCVPNGGVIPQGFSFYNECSYDLLSSHGPWILRSSADNEDWKYASFAGLYSSKIVYTLDNLENEIETLTSSVQNFLLNEYARRMWIARNPNIHYIVQDYIQGEISWVYFSDLFWEWPIVEYVHWSCDKLVNGEIDAYKFYEKKSDSIDPLLSAFYSEFGPLRKLYWSEIDVEWTYKNGKLFFLQIRPIAYTK